MSTDHPLPEGDSPETTTLSEEDISSRPMVARRNFLARVGVAAAAVNLTACISDTDADIGDPASTSDADPWDPIATNDTDVADPAGDSID